MMKEYNFLHLCDHNFKITNKDGVEREIEVWNKKDSVIDLVIDKAIVLSIIEVRAIDYTPSQNVVEFRFDNDKKLQTYEDVDTEDGYFDDRDEFVVDYSKFFKKGQEISEPLPSEYFDPFLHNRIKWNVKPPTKYLVKAKILYSTAKQKTYTLQECPRCQGKGWFVDILNQKGKFEFASGINKVVQRVIKDLLTKLQSSKIDLGYGKNLHTVLRETSADDERTFDLVRLIVSGVEDDYLMRQSEYLNELAPEEVLTSLMVQNISRSKVKNTSILLELAIETQADSRVFRISV